jgi:hypothetical protein
MKEHHPDNGGINEKAQLINGYHEVLKSIKEAYKSAGKSNAA